MVLAILCWLVILNGVTFAAFGSDKKKAIDGLRRTPEIDLLILAAVGGVIGAYAGRAYFRHKTRKQPFSNRLHLTILVQAGLLFGWFF